MYQEIATLKNNWLQQKWATGPVNREKAENSLCEIYQFFGKKPPPIIWCSSPFEAIQVNFLLAQVYEDIHKYFSCFSVRPLTTKLRKSVYQEIEKQENWSLLLMRIVHQISGNLYRLVWLQVQIETLNYQVSDIVDDCVLNEIYSKLDLSINLKDLEWDREKQGFLWDRIRSLSFNTQKCLKFIDLRFIFSFV